jgi:hypothetical protein
MKQMLLLFPYAILRSPQLHLSPFSQALGDPAFFPFIICMVTLDLNTHVCIRMSHPFFQGSSQEAVVYKYDPDTQHQFYQWRINSSLFLNKVKLPNLNVKRLLIVLFGSDTVVYHEFALSCQTVARHVYKGVLHHLQQAVNFRYPGKWCVLITL